MSQKKKLTVSGIVALLGLFVAIDCADAAKIRSSIERRQSPGKGFFESSPKKSYSTPRGGHGFFSRLFGR